MLSLVDRCDNNNTDLSVVASTDAIDTSTDVITVMLSCFGLQRPMR
jgi:hypothetical protein